MAKLGSSYWRKQPRALLDNACKDFKSLDKNTQEALKTIKDHKSLNENTQELLNATKDLKSAHEDTQAETATIKETIKAEPTEI